MSPTIRRGFTGDPAAVAAAFDSYGHRFVILRITLIAFMAPAL
jgi:hypothetical protein